jgi:hypothetical protein
MDPAERCHTAYTNYTEVHATQIHFSHQLSYPYPTSNPTTLCPRLMPPLDRYDDVTRSDVLGLLSTTSSAASAPAHPPPHLLSHALPILTRAPDHPSPTRPLRPIKHELPMLVLSLYDILSVHLFDFLLHL